MKKYALNRRGFTIIELMIALTIVSVILLLAAVIIINVGNLFYKGVTQTKTQDNVRSITDELAGRLQLNSGSVTFVPITPTGGTPQNSTSGSYCIGNQQYTFVLDKQISNTSPYQHVLWRNSITAGQCPTPPDLTLSNPTAGGTELVASDSRLTAFSIVPIAATPEPYTVTVGIAYGDPALTNPATGGGINTFCKGTTGQQFCATSYLVTTVAQRLP